MLPRLTTGAYLPVESPVHRLDARTKILATLAYMVLLLAGHGPWALGACALFTAVALAAARLPAAALWRGNRAVVVLVVGTALLAAVLTPGAPLWRLGPIVVTRQGAATAGATATRLALLVLEAALLTATTTPLDLCAGAERLLQPFRRLGVPAHDLALMAGLALRFLPVLAEEAERIASAQAARGADLGGRARERAVALIALLVPLLLSVLRRADRLALAMEARGYQGAEGRTRWRASRAGAGDLWAATMVAALCAAVVLASWR